MNIGRNDGFILLLTLIFTAVMSLLLVTSMQHVVLYYKAINKIKEQHQNFYHLEEVAMQLAHASTRVSDKQCILYQDSANQVMQQLIHHKGCSVEHGLSLYKYYIEDLGEFPCQVFDNGRKQGATHHRRISVVQIEDGFAISLLQLRYISAASFLSCSTISLGVSSWRYFPLISMK